MRIDSAKEFAVVRIDVDRQLSHYWHPSCGTLTECGVSPSVVVDVVDVNIGDNHILVHIEPVVSGEDFAVFGDDGFSVKNEVGCGFSVAGACIDVGRQTAR